MGVEFMSLARLVTTSEEEEGGNCFGMVVLGSSMGFILVDDGGFGTCC